MIEKTYEHSVKQHPTSQMNVGRWLLRLIKWGVRLGVPFFLLMLLIDFGTSYLVKERVYTNLTDLPYRQHTVVLGTAKFYVTGSPNLYYKYRLEAAKFAYYSKRTDVLLMSGDNKTPYYNEPKMMTRDLEKMGVPSSIIQQDYAGYSTLDSVVRAAKVFKFEPFTIVSQQFHCERALMIAMAKGIDAICYAAKYPDAHYKVRLREFFARTVMAVNLLFGVEPATLAPSQIVEPLKKSANTP